MSYKAILFNRAKYPEIEDRGEEIFLSSLET